MKLLKSLFHVCLFCNDIEKTLDFYKKLGCELMFSMEAPDGGEDWNYYLKVAHNQYIEIQPVNGGNPHPHPEKVNYYENQTAWHFAFETENMAELIRVLNERGIEVFENPEEGAARVYDGQGAVHSPDGCLVCWVKDPDGTPIELMEQVGQTLQRTYDPD